MSTRSAFLSYAQIFAVILVPRLLSASYNIIHDTDETYNYWEPLHFFLHGHGFQTWEYSPAFAIRSWTYIAIHAAPLALLNKFTTREQQFYILRYILGSLSAAAESYFVSSIALELGNEVATLTMFGLAGSAGMFVASTAFLPSSFAMYTSTLGLAFALQRRYFHSTVAFAIGAIIGWPFSVLLFAPLFIFSILEEQIPIYSYVRGVIVSLQILILSTVYDYLKYHIFAIVPLNIVLYNVFAASKGRGPDLFGTEPLSYYLKNLLLNFNIIFVLALIAPASWVLKSRSMIAAKATTSFLLWFIVFSSQAHKEERFMYPAFPTMVLSAAIGLVTLVDICDPLTRFLTSTVNIRQDVFKSTCKMAVILISSMISALRIASLISNYSAPLSLFPSLPHGKHYCIGSDWYRFPTSFLLPPNTTLSFVESSFRGLLPGKFNQTWTVPDGMNNLNEWSRDKVVDVKSCDALITWRDTPSPTHSWYFLDRETGDKRPGYYGYELLTSETNADRLNRLGLDLFGRTLDKEGKRYEEGALQGAIQRDNVKKDL